MANNAPPVTRDAGPSAARRPASTLASWFPELGALPRAGLLPLQPTPVVRSQLADSLWLKRDDLTASPIGGNKVRALDLLLGEAGPGREVLTAGALGSTHVLTTVAHAKALGARVSVVLWPQELNDVARVVAGRITSEADRVVASGSVAATYLRVFATRTTRDVIWVPAGGTSPLGILGHVEGALELAGQVAAHELPAPRRIVVPLGSGGTAAGLAVGAAIAGLTTQIVGVRVVSRIVANRARVMRLAHRTATLIEQLAPGAGLPSLSPDRFVVDDGFFGDAYARPSPSGDAAAARFQSAHGPLRVDPTYSAKALAGALARCDNEPTLFWLTFDSRWLDGQLRPLRS